MHPSSKRMQTKHLELDSGVFSRALLIDQTYNLIHIYIRRYRNTPKKSWVDLVYYKWHFLQPSRSLQTIFRTEKGRLHSFTECADFLLILIFVFVSWVGGGDPPWLCPKCSSCYFRREWAFWTILLAEYPSHGNRAEQSTNKHRKNCECCPGHHLIVDHYSSI